MSQNRQSLYTVAKNSGYGEYVLRPLSAKFLPMTRPETEGKVDRERLLDIHGRGRKRQLALAKQYDIKNYVSPAGGCLLTDPLFSRRLKELFHQQREFTVKDVELLKVGRHFRTASSCKIIAGRNNFDNENILSLSDSSDAIIHMSHYPGPIVLIPGGSDEENIQLAASICALYSDAPNDREVKAICRRGKTVKSLMTTAACREDIEHWMI
jgi:hypothetical protein